MAESFQYVLCPYCGQAQSSAPKCVVCGGLFEPLSRAATQITMGPWFIRDKRLPFRPGCSYEVLKKQIQAGRVKATTVLRGPTTRQFWSVARNTPGVAHLVGFCHACGATVKPDDKSCPKCLAKFEETPQRNELGLMFPTTASAVAAQKAVDRQIAGLTKPKAEKTKKPAGDEVIPLDATHVAQPIDLLNEVLGSQRRAGQQGAGHTQGLDFVSGEDQEGLVSLPPARRFDTVKVLLILLNVLFFAAVITLLIISLNRQPTPTPTGSPSPGSTTQTAP